MFAYLEAYFKVFTELGAAAQFAVQALVNKAVQLVGAIAAVVFMVAEQCLINAVSIVADVSSLVAFLLCFKRKVEREKSERRGQRSTRDAEMLSEPGNHFSQNSEIISECWRCALQACAKI